MVVLMMIPFYVKCRAGGVLATVGEGDQLRRLIRARQTQCAHEFCRKQLGRLEMRLNHVDERLHHIDERFDRVDQRFDQVDRRFEHVDERFDELRRFMLVLHENMKKEFAATSERDAVSRPELHEAIADLKENIERRLDPLELAVRQQSAAKRKRTRH